MISSVSSRVRPLLTKSITSGIISCAGSCIAQVATQPQGAATMVTCRMIMNQKYGHCIAQIANQPLSAKVGKITPLWYVGNRQFNRKFSDHINMCHQEFLWMLPERFSSTEVLSLAPSPTTSTSFSTGWWWSLLNCPYSNCLVFEKKWLDFPPCPILGAWWDWLLFVESYFPRLFPGSGLASRILRVLTDRLVFSPAFLLLTLYLLDRLKVGDVDGSLRMNLKSKNW